MAGKELHSKGIDAFPQTLERRPVTPSGAKGLARRAERCFAPLILRCIQDECNELIYATAMPLWFNTLSISFFKRLG